MGSILSSKVLRRGEEGGIGSLETMTSTCSEMPGRNSSGSDELGREGEGCVLFQK